MTAKDPFPIGKNKGVPIGDISQFARKWFLEQSWFLEKYPDIVAIWSGKEVEVSTTSERETLVDEGNILATMPKDFQLWWHQAYGTRLRTAGGMNYIPFLRVAKEAWLACEKRKPKDPTPVQPNPSSPDEDIPF